MDATANKDLVALNSLIDEALNEEKELQAVSDKLALRDKEFATFLRKQEQLRNNMEVLWAEVKEYMESNQIFSHKTDFIELKLTPTGRFKTDDVDKAPDEVCDVKKVLNNKKVKAYLELHGSLPEGIESCGYALRKKLLTNDNNDNKEGE